MFPFSLKNIYVHDWPTKPQLYHHQQISAAAPYPTKRATPSHASPSAGWSANASEPKPDSCSTPPRSKSSEWIRPVYTPTSHPAHHLYRFPLVQTVFEIHQRRRFLSGRIITSGKRRPLLLLIMMRSRICIL